MEDLKMLLFREIFAQAVMTGKIQVAFSGMESTVAEVIEDECFQALVKIKTVLDDNDLDDTECFDSIEKIVSTLEKIGSNGGCRHDFG